MQNKYHETVLIKEVTNEMPIGKVIDCTLGTGGHYLSLKEKGCLVLGIDADPKMILFAQNRIPDGLFVQGNFTQIDNLCLSSKFIIQGEKIDGVLLDLGVSNIHLKEDSRGFSFSESNQELDMRLNRDIQGVKAMDLLNALNIKALEDLFNKVMNKNLSKLWAKKIIEKRPFRTVGDLKKIAYTMPHKTTLDSATLPMLALRIAVNSEYENLQDVLPKAFNLLKSKGKLLVITFHSGEDNILLDTLGKANKIIYPNDEEIRTNPRSRSAKLHIYEKN